MANIFASLLLQGISSITHMASFLLLRGVAAALLLLFWIIKLPGIFIGRALCCVRELAILLFYNVIRAANPAQSGLNKVFYSFLSNTGSYVADLSNATLTATKQQGEDAFKWVSYFFHELLPEAFELVSVVAVDILKIVFENMKDAYELFNKYARKFDME